MPETTLRNAAATPDFCCARSRGRIAGDTVLGPNSPFRLKNLEPYAEAARAWLVEVRPPLGNRERGGARARERGGAAVGGGWQTVRVTSTETAGEPGNTATSASEHTETDRDAAPQFVLPLVVRIEREAPPARTDALETAARAVLVLLSDERSAGDGEWAAAVRDWQDARIRKVVRRARRAEWRRAEALPGITVTGHEAEVRVFPPVPLDGWPKDLARLQVSGTELDDPQPPGPPAAGPVLWFNPGLEMSAGKKMAQAGHGAQLA